MATSGAELATQLARMSPNVTKRRHVILLNQIAGTAELAAQRHPTAAVVLVIISKGMLRRERKLPWEKTVLTPSERLHWQQIRRQAKTLTLSLDAAEVQHDAFFSRLVEQTPSDCFVMAASEVDSKDFWVIRRIARSGFQVTHALPEGPRLLEDKYTHLGFRHLCHRCFHCGASGCTHKCGKCQFAYYCNIECQKLHWHEHRELCAILSE